MTVFVLLRRRTEAFSEAEFAALLEEEAEEARRLYRDGITRHIYSRQDVLGALMQIEVASLEEAKAAIGRLPLVAKDMIEATFVPVGPYRGFLPKS